MRARFVFLWVMLVTILYLAVSRLQHQSPPVEKPSERATPMAPATPVIETVAPLEVRAAPLKPGGPTVAEFRRTVREAQQSLPQIEEIRRRSNAETHYPPPELYRSAEAIAKVVDAMQANTALIPEGLAFFTQCARDEQTMTASRAVCLLYLRHWARRAKDFPVRENDIPAEVTHLADRLPLPTE